MNWKMIPTLVWKDTLLYSRNRFVALMSVLGVVAYAVIYFLMPNSVDETLLMGIVAPNFPQAFLTNLEDAGVEIAQEPTAEAMVSEMEAGAYDTGVVFPATLIADLSAGKEVDVQVYFTSDIPADMQEYFLLFIEELGFMLNGQQLNVEGEEYVLGRNLVGEQIPARDRMLPMFSIMILMVETIGLATLLSSEIAAGTIRALLITPMTMTDLFAGKTLMGVLMAFAQVSVLLIVTGGLKANPPLILLIALLGCYMITGVAFLVAATSSDMMSVIGWTVPVILVLSLPAFGVLFPGTMTNWVKFIPSYYLVDAMHKVVNFGLGWGDVTANLLTMLVSGTIFLSIGIIVLRRKMR